MGICLGVKLLFYVPFQGNTSGAGILFLTQGFHQQADIRILLCQFSGTEFQPCHVQEAVYEQGHLLRLPFNDSNTLQVFFLGTGVFPDIAALGQDDGGGGPQFMGCIGGKLFFCFKGVFQAFKHMVKAAGQAQGLI